MKTRILITVLLVCETFVRISSQTYSVTDSLALLAIDNSCDASNSLNWNTASNPGNWDGVIWNAENPKGVAELRIYDRSLTGIMTATALSNLTYLSCSNNQLTGLDVSTLTNLTYLSCYNNQLTALDVSDLINLTDLICSTNQLTVLEVSNLVNLTYLGCSVNQLNNLDVSDLIHLTYLACNVNHLTFLDVSQLTNLTELYCHANQITSLDVSELINLTLLSCYSNQITSLDVSALINLTSLYCSSNPLGELDVSELTNLTFLSCFANQLTSLDISALTNLTTLVCSSNQLTALEVSALVNLTFISCYDNRLNELDVSALTSLTLLLCDHNELTSLDVSALTNLTQLNCSENRLTELNVSALSNLVTLECWGNRLLFSSLATGLHTDQYSYTPQDTLFDTQNISGNTTIDYSAEALIDGVSTQFVFFKDDVEVETNNTGIFSTTGTGVYYCKMTNTKIPDLTLITSYVTVTSSTGIDVTRAAEINIYPNPAKDIVHLRFILNKENLVKIEIYSLNGSLVSQPFSSRMMPAEHNINIDLTHLPKGIYMVKLRAGYELLCKKFMLL